jgi:hypothetical protein
MTTPLMVLIIFLITVGIPFSCFLYHYHKKNTSPDQPTPEGWARVELSHKQMKELTSKGKVFVPEMDAVLYRDNRVR